MISPKLPYKYSDGGWGKAAKATREAVDSHWWFKKGDCVIKSLTNLIGHEKYTAVFNKFKDAKSQNPVYAKEFGFVYIQKRALQEFYCPHYKKPHKYTEKELHEKLRADYSQYILRVSKHVAAVKDGTLLDTMQETTTRHMKGCYLPYKEAKAKMGNRFPKEAQEEWADSIK